MQGGTGGLVEGRAGAESVVFVRRALEHRLEQLHFKNVFRVGQILGHFLFNRAALLFPEGIRAGDVAHAGGFDAQGHFQILGRRGEEILREGLLGVGVKIAAQTGGDVGQLVGGKTGSAPEHHVLRRVSHAREIGRAFVRADFVIDDGCDHRRERVGHDDDAQAVGQSRADDICFRVEAGRRRDRGSEGSQFKFEKMRHKFCVFRPNRGGRVG